MVVVVSRRRPAARSSYSFGWFMWVVSVFRRLWARRNLSPQERANLLASYSPVGVLAAAPAGQMDDPRGASGLNGLNAGRRRVN